MVLQQLLLPARLLVQQVATKVVQQAILPTLQYCSPQQGHLLLTGPAGAHFLLLPKESVLLPPGSAGAQRIRLLGRTTFVLIVDIPIRATSQLHISEGGGGGRGVAMGQIRKPTPPDPLQMVSVM